MSDSNESKGTEYDNDSRVKRRDVSPEGEEGVGAPIITKMSTLDETDIIDLQSKIQQMVTKEIETQIQTNTRPLTSTENPAIQNMPLKNAIDISLQGLNLPSHSIVDLEGRLQKSQLSYRLFTLFRGFY